jgi:hypothetical protein
VLFLIALVSIFGVAWWFARGDRRFKQRTLAANYELPPGKSLNDLNLPAAAEPITTNVDSAKS